MSLSRTSCPSPRRFFGGEWTLASKRVPEPIFACPCTSLGEDRHLLIGGEDENLLLEYNSTMKLFSSHTLLPNAIDFPVAAIAIDDQRLLVVFVVGADSVVAIYDTKTKEWSKSKSKGPALKRGGLLHTFVSTRNKVYAFGGWDHRHRPDDSIEVLDLSVRNPSWRILPQRLKKKRSGCQAVVDPKNPNNIIVVGGYDEKGEVLSCCEVVSLQEGQQTRTIPSLMAPRGMHAMVLVENRFLVVMGGSNVVHGLASVEVLDLDEAGEEQRWHPLPPMNTGRWGLAAFYSPRNHKIVVAGGFDGQALDTIEEMEVKVEIEEGRSGLALANGPHCQPQPRPPPLTSQPVACCAVAQDGEVEAEEGEEQKESCVGVSSDGGDPEYVWVGEGDSKRLRL